MASLRTWRTVTVALLLLVVLASTATTTTAGATTPSHQQAHYCKQVDAYRLKTCATAMLPAGPLGQQLRWELDQLAGEAATLTEAEVQAHVSPEFLTVMFPPKVVIQFFQQNLAERGPFTFIGFAYPPRARQALALLQTATGERGALPIGVTGGHPALIEYLDLQQAPPTIVAKSRSAGWFDIGGRRLFLRCTGHGSPTVVFEGGLTTDWYDVQNRLAPFTPGPAAGTIPTGPGAAATPPPPPGPPATLWPTCTPCCGWPMSLGPMCWPATPTVGCTPSFMPAPILVRWPGWS
jgi:hypothetical protein